LQLSPQAAISLSRALKGLLKLCQASQQRHQRQQLPYSSESPSIVINTVTTIIFFYLGNLIRVKGPIVTNTTTIIIFLYLRHLIR
jgi:hypothetical protein